MFWFNGITVYPNAFYAVQGMRRTLDTYEIDVFCEFVRYAMKKGNDKLYRLQKSIETVFDLGDDKDFFDRNKDYIRVQNYISYTGKEMTEKDIDDINLKLGFGLPLFAFEVARVWFRRWMIKEGRRKYGVVGELSTVCDQIQEHRIRSSNRS